MNIVVFEDAGAEQLFPITTGRAAYTITCATYTLVELLSELDGNLIGVVRPYLQTIQKLDFPSLGENFDSQAEWTLVVTRD